ncbi:MAG: glyoxylate/hydroxypyruvate reductase A [Pseudomonadota bacterium]
MMTICYGGTADDADMWDAAMRTALSQSAALADQVRYWTTPEDGPAEDVDFLLFTPNGTIADLAPYTSLKAIQSLWAGVESYLARTDLPSDVPLLRMVEPGLSQGMVDYVVTHTLRHHMDLDYSLERSRGARWDEVHPPLTSERGVGILGLGALGQACGSALRAIGFQVSGWSRSPKNVAGIRSFVGSDGLELFLRTAETLIVLVPETPETTGLLDAQRLACLPEGAHIINVARGPVLSETALLAALEQNVGTATLDVFDTEPLPEDHAFWRHERITITPHIASVTRPETASKEVVRQIERYAAGQKFQHVVDKSRGY